MKIITKHKKPLGKPFTVEKMNGMTGKEEILFTLLLAFGLGLTCAFGLWWLEPQHISHNGVGFLHIFDYLLFAALTYIVWQQIAMEVFSWYVVSDIAYPDKSLVPEENLRVAYLTAFVPGAEPYDMLEKTLKAMVGVDYPHDTWLLDEGNDETAQSICASLGVKHYSRKGIAKFNMPEGKFKARTKGGNYNSWLQSQSANYDIVAQHDIDFIPKKNYLTRTLGYFRDETVAFVGTPQVYGNLDENWIARGAAEQTYGFYGPLQKGFYSHDMTLLIGANHIFRMKAYQDIGGYTAHIAEDMLTGMKLYTHKNKWRGLYVPEVLLVGEGPTTWVSYFGQQMRWAYGCMDIVMRHSAPLLMKMRLRHIFNYIVLQQFYFSGIAQVIGIGMISLYFLFGITAASMTLLPILVLYIPLLIYQVLFQLWLQRFNVDPQNERGLLLRGKLLSLAAWPVYFLAFVGVVRGKRLTYVVTPKGDNQEITYEPSLFNVHFVLGTITLAGIFVGLMTHHAAAQIVFWAILNTVVMYYFYFAEAIPAAFVYFKKLAVQSKKSLVSLKGAFASK